MILSEKKDMEQQDQEFLEHLILCFGKGSVIPDAASTEDLKHVNQKNLKIFLDAVGVQNCVLKECSL